MPQGSVSLVGAGPWEEGLLTLKGKSALEGADVVIYDALVNPRLLHFCRRRAKKVYVGKRGGKERTRQERINSLLVSYARRGRKVVRLKGGDPFLFGRGAEEALFLAKRKIPFEVVPGVSSALAVPAYSGIPLTDRDLSSSVGIFTGQERPDRKRSKIRFREIAKGLDTLVFLMGVETLPTLTKRLMKARRSAATPCALISWGTSVRQKTVVGTLKTIVAKAQAEELEAPAILVVGKVVALRRNLDWFESRPLSGKRILVTRPLSQGKEFGELLKKKGAEVLYLPTIEIVPLKGGVLRKALVSLPTADWVFFTSVNGVNRFAKQLGVRLKALVRAQGFKIGAIGPKTKKALEEKGFSVAFMPRTYTQEGMVHGLKARKLSLKGKRVFLFNAKGSRDLLVKFLRRQKAKVSAIPLYESRLPRQTKRLRALLEKQHAPVDAVTFTSSSTVDHFVDLFSGKFPKSLLNGTRIASIGPVTSATCRAHGLHVDIEAKTHTTEGLLQALVEQRS